MKCRLDLGWDVIGCVVKTTDIENVFSVQMQYDSKWFKPIDALHVLLIVIFFIAIIGSKADPQCLLPSIQNIALFDLYCVETIDA